jgi:large repetitive protein
MHHKLIIMLLILLPGLLPAQAFALNVLDGFGAYSSVLRPPLPGVRPEIRALAIQPWDGKVLIGGQFAIRGSAQRNLARLNPDGSLDTGFTPGTSDAGDLVNSILIQPDSAPDPTQLSRILVGGRFTQIVGEPRNGLARLSSSGTVDTLFNPAPADAATNPAEIAAIALYPDGSILLGGVFSRMGGSPCGSVARISGDASGTLSDDFAGGVSGRVNAILAQGTSVVLGGSFSLPASVPLRANLARFRVLGGRATLDPDFPAAPNAQVRSLALQVDGKLLVGGDFTAIATSAFPLGGPRQHLARLDSTGALDPGFDPGAPGAYVATLALQPDGNILAGGDFNAMGGTGRRFVARLDFKTGALDGSFNLEPDGAVQAILVQADQNLLVAGSFLRVAGGAKTRTALARYHRSGALDDDIPFSSNGAVTRQVIAISVQPDGSVAFGGHEFFGDNLCFGWVPPNWQLPDLATWPIFDNQIDVTMPQPDGSLLVSGVFSETILRLTPQGQIDPTFHFDNHDGDLFRIQALAQPRPRDPARPNVLETVVGGMDWENFAPFMLKLDHNGNAIQEFSDNVAGNPYLTEEDTSVLALAIEPGAGLDYKILVGSGEKVFRLNQDGSLDPSFPVVQTTNFWIRSLALLPDGNILCTGGPYPDPTLPLFHDRLIVRLFNGKPGHIDGSVDDSFHPEMLGWVLTGASLQTNGDIIIAGVLHGVWENGVVQPIDYITRIDRDGKLDHSFDLGSFVDNTGGFFNTVNGAKLQEDGKMLIHGAFTSMNGDPMRRHLTRAANGWAPQKLSVLDDTTVEWRRGGGRAGALEGLLRIFGGRIRLEPAGRGHQDPRRLAA